MDSDKFERNKKELEEELKDSEERKKFEEFKMKKRIIQKRLRPTLSSPEGEMGKGDLEPGSKRLKWISNGWRTIWTLETGLR